MGLITHKDIASKVLGDMYSQGVTVRQAGDLFKVRFAYFCHLKHEERYSKIPSKFWIKLRAYCNSGKRLTDFKV